MNHIRIAGVDDGRVNKKIVTTDPAGQLVYYTNTNCISPGYKRRTADEKVEDLKNRLHARVKRNGQVVGEFFTGQLALEANRDDLRMQTAGIYKFASEKMVDDAVKIVMDLAYITYQQGENHVHYLVGYGVPAEEYYEDYCTKDFETYLKAQWEVLWLDPAFVGSPTTYIGVADIDDKGLEGAASLLSAVYDDNLEIRGDVAALLEKGDLIGINLGSSTFDAAGMKSDMSYISKLFFGVPQGTNKAINRTKVLIKERHDVELKPLLLDQYMRSANVIRAQGNEIDLHALGTIAYSELIPKIKTEFLNKLDEVGYERHAAGGLIMFGGLVENLQKRFPEHVKGLDGWLGKAQTILSPNALFDEARGYFLKAKINYIKPLIAEVDETVTEAPDQAESNQSGIEIIS